MLGVRLDTKKRRGWDAVPIPGIRILKDASVVMGRRRCCALQRLRGIVISVIVKGINVKAHTRLASGLFEVAWASVRTAW